MTCEKSGKMGAILYLNAYINFLLVLSTLLDHSEWNLVQIPTWWNWSLQILNTYSDSHTLLMGIHEFLCTPSTFITNWGEIWLRFFRAFSSVVRQTPGYDSHKTWHGPHFSQLSDNFYTVSSSLILVWPIWFWIPESLPTEVVNCAYSATLTEVFPYCFLSCKANAGV